MDGQILTRAAFEKALPALRPDIHRFCSRMTGSVIDGEDVLQIALMKAFEALARGDEVVNLRSWLFRIAHNAALDHLRAKKREIEMHDSTEPFRAAHVMMPQRRELEDGLRPYIALTPGQRSSVIFRDVFGYTAPEVAQLTGASIESVKASLHRGRAALKQARAAPANEAGPLSGEEKRRLTRYAGLFNDREFDRLRDMLSAEVKLELVSRTRMAGKKEVSSYFGNYDRVYDWLMTPGRVEGRPAILAFDPENVTGGPVYFILLGFDNNGVRHIRDFRYARYVMTDAVWERSV